MRYSPLLLLHITGGTVGLISGFVTIALRKGSRRHRIAGFVFVAAMLTMASIGAYLATRRFEPGNILGGTLTFYMVATAAMAFRPRVRLTRFFDRSALLLAAGVGATELSAPIKPSQARPANGRDTRSVPTSSSAASLYSPPQATSGCFFAPR